MTSPIPYKLFLGGGVRSAGLKGMALAYLGDVTQIGGATTLSITFK